jgi:excisionase family DNA binding protein
VSKVPVGIAEAVEQLPGMARTKEVAAALQISRRQVERLVQSGEIPSVAVSPQVVRIPKPLLLEWLARRLRASA